MEVKEVPVGGTIKDPVTGEERPNMIMSRVMDKKSKQTSAVLLNYDILSKMMGIDFERIDHPDEPITPTVEATPKKESEQGDLPF